MPILVDHAGMVIAGHARLMAAQLLELPEVPVIVADDWTDAQKKAYVLADNKLALNAGWNDELLMLELGDLRNVGFDLGLIGFASDELDELLDATAEMKEVTDTLRPKHFLRVLISVPIDSAVLVKDQLAGLETVPGIEIDYGAN